jgi:hypothetical protein
VGSESNRELNCESAIRQTCWWLTDVLSQLLEPGEREVVFGDFAETRETAFHALREMTGLVVRRQASVWTDWRPWLILAGVIAPLAMLISIVSRNTAYVSAIYLWLYINNSDWELLKNPGFWRLLAETVGSLSIWFGALVCSSWTIGFVIGSVSRGMSRINGALLCLMLLLGELLGAPLYVAYCEQYVHRVYGVPALPDYNAAVFDVAFYRAMFPLLVQALLVAIPALRGMRQGLGTTALRPRLRKVLWVAALTTLTSMVIQDRGFWLLVGRHIVSDGYMRRDGWLGWGMRVLQFVVYWPAVYLAASAIIRRPQHRTMASA